MRGSAPVQRLVMSVVSHCHPLHSSAALQMCRLGSFMKWEGLVSADVQWHLGRGRGKVTQNQQSVNCGHAIHDT